jgi:hypothetical protein
MKQKTERSQIYPGFFEVMPSMTKAAFVFFALAKLCGLFAIVLMWASHTLAGVLFGVAMVSIAVSVSCSAYEMLRDKSDKSEFLALKKRYEKLAKVYGD